jgi:DNA-binding GntR family transcriptional regulator
MTSSPPKVQLPTLSADGVLTAHKTVADRIRNAVIAGELPGGTRLVQADLAKSLSVSITPVREALRDLIADGLLDFDAFRGATVHETTLAELEELYELRRTLVPMAVKAAVKEITAEELDHAEQVALRMRALKDPGEWVRLNREFHSILDGASRRPHLQDILGRLADLSALYVGLSISSVKGRRTRGDRDHMAMVETYRAGDVDGAVKLALSHLSDTVDVARESVVQRAI